MSATGPNIDKISKIIVNHGEVVDGLTITYATPGGPKTETHGGQTGNVATITLSGDEYLVGAYGNYGPQSTTYGSTSITKLRFVIVNRSTSDVRVEGPFGASRPSTAFDVTGEIKAFAGYLADNDRFIRALSFTKN